jgi:predicted phosphodiesterase
MGVPLDPAELWDRIHDPKFSGKPQRVIAETLGIGQATVNKYMRIERPVSPSAMPDPAPEAGGPGLPDPVPLSYDPYPIDTSGAWLVLGDVHLPYHDKRTVEVAVDEARRRGAVGVLLNGDLLDCYQLSSHYREPDKGRFRDEIDCGKAFLAWLRSRFPRGRIVYKEGNHDDRLRRYLAERAPALFDLPGFDLPGFLGLQNLGVEWVGDKRVIHLGRLPVVHGHEFRGGGGVNPARWLFLRAVSTALCGHFHRTSEHHEQSLDRRVHGVWSVGCACYLHPQYDPNNKWNHGYAIVDVASRDGGFSVTNRRLLRDGRVV